MTTNASAKAEMAAVLEGVQQQMRTIAQIQQDRALLVGTATVRKHVTVSVNADGTVIETKFGPGVEDLTYGEIAGAVTAAAQEAAADLGRKMQELMGPLQDQRARLPKLTELIEDMPDLRPPEPPAASLAAPDAAERSTESVDEDAPMTFTDVETVDHAGERARGVTDSSW